MSTATIAAPNSAASYADAVGAAVANKLAESHWYDRIITAPRRAWGWLRRLAGKLPMHHVRRVTDFAKKSLKVVGPINLGLLGATTVEGRGVVRGFLRLVGKVLTAPARLLAWATRGVPGVNRGTAAVTGWLDHAGAWVDRQLDVGQQWLERHDDHRLMHLIREGAWAAILIRLIRRFAPTNRWVRWPLYALALIAPSGLHYVPGGQTKAELEADDGRRANVLTRTRLTHNNQPVRVDALYVDGEVWFRIGRAFYAADKLPDGWEMTDTARTLITEMAEAERATEEVAGTDGLAANVAEMAADVAEATTEATGPTLDDEMSAEPPANRAERREAEREVKREAKAGSPSPLSFLRGK